MVWLPIIQAAMSLLGNKDGANAQSQMGAALAGHPAQGTQGAPQQGGNGQQDIMGTIGKLRQAMPQKQPGAVAAKEAQDESLLGLNKKDESDGILSGVLGNATGGNNYA